MAPHLCEKRIVGVSLKMYFDLTTTLDYVTSIAKLSTSAEQAGVDLFIVPDFIAISTSASRLSNTSVILGAQNCSSEDKGAYTGEISPVSLKQAGVRTVVVGHAERRKLFGESNQDVAKKAAAVVRNGMIPLLCVGEQHQSNIASQAVGMAISECQTQIQAVTSSIPDIAELIIAYEPVWAIGASQPAGPDHVIAVTRHLRELVASRKGRTRILYGGAAGPGTFQHLKEGVDGLFLGRFAHNIDNLAQVITEMKQ